jgi:hypothetical protein
MVRLSLIEMVYFGRITGGSPVDVCWSLHQDLLASIRRPSSRAPARIETTGISRPAV